MNKVYHSTLRQGGFSLVEVGVVLLILGIVLASFSNLFELVFNTDHELEERQNMAKVHGAINTFLLVNSYLPCPDTDNDGIENRQDGGGGVMVCTSREGYLPYNDLGVQSKDAWGNEYYYRVNQRSTLATYVNEICQSASVLGKSGTVGVTDMWLCPDTNVYYCKDAGGASPTCNDLCTSNCINTIDPRPSPGSPPFFHLFTPPYGSIAGSFNLNIYDENAAPYDGSIDPMGGPDGHGVVAVIVSWGANGSSVYRYDSTRNSCGGGTVAENINCTNSLDFVDIKTGENRDFLTWVTVNQAKMAIMGKGAFQ